jgi:hypothetical protein
MPNRGRGSCRQPYSPAVERSALFAVSFFGSAGILNFRNYDVWSVEGKVGKGLRGEALNGVKMGKDKGKRQNVQYDH